MTRYQIRRFVSVFFLGAAISAFFATGCQTQPVLSDMQRRTITTRIIRGGTYRDVYRACLTVLQDEGYIIKNSNYEVGLITATASKGGGGSGSAFWILMGGQQQPYHANTMFELSLNLEELVADETEARMSIQRVEMNNLGGVIQSRQLLDPELYRNYFQKVQTEVYRRVAMQKGRRIEEE